MRFADDWSVHVHGRIRVVVVSGMHPHVLCADAPLRFVLKGGVCECAAITTNEKKGGCGLGCGTQGCEVFSGCPLP